MIAGFYLVSHEMGDRDEFTHPIHHNRDVDKWRYSLRALRAFSYLPEYRLNVREFDPLVLKNARSISAMGEIISDPKKIGLLRDTPWVDVDVYTPNINEPLTGTGAGGSGKVRAGPASKSGYEVTGGAYYLPREL